MHPGPGFLSTGRGGNPGVPARGHPQGGRLQQAQPACGACQKLGGRNRLSPRQPQLFLGPLSSPLRGGGRLQRGTKAISRFPQASQGGAPEPAEGVPWLAASCPGVTLLVSAWFGFPLDAHTVPGPTLAASRLGLQLLTWQVVRPGGRASTRRGRTPGLAWGALALCGAEAWAPATVVSREGSFQTSAQCWGGGGAGSWLPCPPLQMHRPPQASPLPRGPTSCRTTVSPSSSGWPRACSIWRKHPRYGGAGSPPPFHSPCLPSPHPRVGPGPRERTGRTVKPEAQRGPGPGCWLPLPTVTCAPRPQFLAFTCGLLRGTLCTLGVKSLVTASVAALPACESGRWGWRPSRGSGRARELSFLAPACQGGGAGLPSPT